MQYQNHISFLDDDVPQDDIDRLFSLLQPIEPPPSFISRILSQIPAKVHTSSTLLFSLPVVWNRLDRWIVRKERQKLC